MSERMSNEKAIELLKNDCCYECSWGCRNPIECNNKECDYRQAIITAIESLDENERLKKERDYILEKAKLEKVKAELKDNEWVNVKDRLPSESGRYLITYLLDGKIRKNNCLRNMQVAWYDIEKKVWLHELKDTDEIVAWKKVEPYERKE